MEKLSHLINQRVNTWDWKCEKISREGPHISHIFFADDLILLGQGSVTQAEKINDCLDTFCNLSEQQISFPKSCIFYSCNTNERVAKIISEFCGSPLTKNLGKYLGVPLIYGTVSKRTYGVMVEKVQSGLAAWKSDTLSLAGRVTLIKDVTFALLVYTMQSVKLTSDICLKLDKLNMNFLWDHTDAKKTTHLFKWDTVCLPKKRGGLGIKRMKGMNHVLLAKIGWQILQNDNGNPRDARTILVAWDLPNEGYVKLNVDGGCTGKLGFVTDGGVLHDHLKNWLEGFVLNKGFGSVIEPKF
ncbi:hypothetical protein Dsin_012525 [Dipteronia sinensis]|uniref:Uncharacterized protein n=1 Tax=Dipteronia sinensis TaxID=43782 RepID=A0AAE0AIX6_9ROSI|nr:hypothetical protein Dsin_012525 [Dipteronia sinensis]